MGKKKEKIKEQEIESVELTDEELSESSVSIYEKRAEKKITEITGDTELTQDEKVVLSDEEKKLAEAKRRKKLRNEITHKLRFKILQRDNFTCQACGRSPKIVPGLALEVDHIKEIDMGGTNDEDNLQTLCWECNEGKKGTEFQPPKREYDLKVQKIKDVAETSNFESMIHFLSDDENEEERQWLYKMHEEKGSTHCIRDCKQCASSGSYFFRRCFVQLHQHINIDQLQVESTPTVERGKENIITSTANNLLCDFCYISKRCPKFKVGANCAYDFTADVDFTDTKAAWQIILNIQKERVIRASMFEKRDGGAVDKNLSGEIAMLKGLIESYEAVNRPSASFTITGQGTGNQGVGEVGKMLASIFTPKETKALPEPTNDKILPEATEVEPIEIPEKEQIKVKK